MLYSVMQAYLFPWALKKDRSLLARMRSAAVGCEVRGTSFLEVVHALADCGVVVVGGGAGLLGQRGVEQLAIEGARTRI